MPNKLGIILLVNAFLVLYLSFVSAPTMSEARFVTSGLYVWKEAAFSLAGDVPPLAPALATLPVLARQPKLNPLKSDSLYDLAEYESKVVRELAAGYGTGFFTLVRIARLAGLLWWLAGAWVIVRWARELYGAKAGWLALVLWCFEPNVLAREGLATPDLAAAVACLAATFALWRWLKVPSWEKSLWAGMLLGLAQLTEFSALVLFAIWPIAALIQRWGAQPELSHRMNAATRRLAQTALMFAVCVWVINLGYASSGTGSRLDKYAFVSRLLTGASQKDTGSPFGHSRAGNRFRGAPLGRLIVLLPADYLHGIDRRLRYADSRWDSASTERQSTEAPARDFTHRGRLTLVALVVKIPLGLWVMLMASAAMMLRGRPAQVGVADELTVWIPLVVLPVAAATRVGDFIPLGGLPIVVPFAIIAASQLAGLLPPGGGKRGWLVVALPAWVVGSSLASYPRPLEYLSELASGPNRVAVAAAHACPGDSGEDVLALIDWLKQHLQARPVGLACWSAIDPAVFRVESMRPPVAPGPWLADLPWYSPRRVGPYPGYYALDLDHLSFPQYAHFLKFQPVYRAGSSILVYHITPDEAATARRELGLPDLGDAALLKDWLSKHPEAHPIGIECSYVIDDPRTFGIGIAYQRPPSNPGPKLANEPWYTLRIGPYPGYYAVDDHALSSPRYRYFSFLNPVARIGSSISVYDITPVAADRVRQMLGLPLLGRLVRDRARVSDRGFSHHVFDSSAFSSGRYSLFIPPDYTGAKPYPLILFLHGYGDAFDEAPGQRRYLEVGLPPAVVRREDSFGFFVLCPHSHSGSWHAYGDDAERALAILAQVERDYNINSERIYLTGLSSGAAGVWDLAARHPDRWAAIVPVASSGCNTTRAPAIKHIPCWCFHNLRDHDSPVEIPRKMVAALKDAGGAPSYSEFGVLFDTNLQNAMHAHNAWDGAYNMDELYEWLIQPSK